MILLKTIGNNFLGQFWSQWSAYTDCTGECGLFGTHNRTRTCNKVAQHNHGDCPGDGFQQEECQKVWNTVLCPAGITQCLNSI